MRLAMTQISTRRALLGLAAALPAMLVLAPGERVGAQILKSRPTPACGEATSVTPRQTAGPFFIPNSPLRTSLLEPGLEGARMVLEGTVRGSACRPVSGALVDVWHADAHGRYDNTGYRLRGHQFTDEAGHYRLETIMPGQYPGRTRHFHIKVQAPHQPVLTTQLYFPGEAANRRDGLFMPDLVMQVQDRPGYILAAFDFVLQDSAS